MANERKLNWMEDIEDAVKGFEGTGSKTQPLVPSSSEPVISRETIINKRKDEILNEPKLAQPEIRARALDFSERISNNLDRTYEYKHEILEAEMRHVTAGEFVNHHTYVITLGSSRYKIYRTRTSDGTYTLRLSRRDKNALYTDADHRLEEAERANTDWFWAQEIEMVAPSGKSSSNAVLRYNGPDPYGEEILGSTPFRITDIQRASVGIEKFIERFEADRRYLHHPEF